MVVKLFVILVFISIGDGLGGDGLLKSIFSGIDSVLEPEEVNDTDDDTEGTGDSKKDEHDDQESEENEVQPQGVHEETTEAKDSESEWDCIALSGTISKCTLKKQLAAFERKVPSGAASIPNIPPKGVPEPQVSVIMKGSLQEGLADFFGAIAKIKDKVKENIESSVQKILGN